MSERRAGVEFGWGARTMAEQFPALPSMEALAFDADNAAIIRLHVRGIISDGELRRAIKRCTKRIETTLRALTAGGQK